MLHRRVRELRIKMAMAVLEDADVICATCVGSGALLVWMHRTMCVCMCLCSSPRLEFLPFLLIEPLVAFLLLHE